MTTTVESNMLNMHQSPLVLGWGQNAINASFPINAKKLQVVYPSSGNISENNPWRPNVNVELRQLLDKNSAMSLHGSYLNVSFAVGRIQEWLPQPATTVSSGNISFQDLAPLDLMDRFLLYTHWNPCRLIQNATLWLGSTNVETVNNVPLVTDAKYAFYSQEAVKYNMSDCFVLPADGQCSINGASLIYPVGNIPSGVELQNTIRLFQDCSVNVADTYSIMNKDFPTPTGSIAVPPATVAEDNRVGPYKAESLMCVEPLEYYLRTAHYSNPVGSRYVDYATSIYNTVTLGYEMPVANTDDVAGPGLGSVSYFNYSNRLADNAAQCGCAAGGLVPIAGAYPELTKCIVTKRIPLSELFGFCEQNVLVPSNLLQINLTRATDDQFITNLYYPSSSDGTTAYQARRYGIVVSDMYLVMKYYDLNQTAADLLSQDQLLTVNHYSVYQNTIAGTGTQQGSYSLQTFAGLKSIIIRIQPSWAPQGTSIPVAQQGNISVIYRGKQSPLQLQQWDFQLNPPVQGSQALVHQGGPPIRCNPSTYFEEYSSWNGNCWNGVSAALAPSAGHSILTWMKSQFTVPFNFVEDQSQNSDTVAAPIQVNYNFGATPMYDPVRANPNGMELPNELATNAKNTINVVFLRTNILKYLGSSRQLVFVTNGSS